MPSNLEPPGFLTSVQALKVSLPRPDRSLFGGLPAVSRLRLKGGRRPPEPGHFLETRFMQPLGLTQDGLARQLGISRRRVNELLRGRRGITPDTAVRLALLFGLEPAFWMGLQMHWDLYRECHAPPRPRERLQGARESR